MGVDLEVVLVEVVVDSILPVAAVADLQAVGHQVVSSILNNQNLITIELYNSKHFLTLILNYISSVFVLLLNILSFVCVL